MNGSEMWNVKKEDGNVYGPADTNTIRQWIGEQRVSADDLISLAGKEEWIRIAEVSQFADLFAPAPVSETPVAVVGNVCQNHPRTEAVWRCTSCGGYFCSMCIKAASFGKGSFQICNVCGGKCESTETKVRQEEVIEESFWKQIPRSFSYPFSGSGGWLLGIGTVSFGIAAVIARYSLLGVFLSLGIAGYLCAYMFSIIQTSAKGEKKPPDFPEIGNLLDDVIVPFFQVMFTALISFIIPPLGIIYFPMALISVAIFNSVRGVDPRLVFPSLVRAPKEYLVAIFLFYLVIVISSVSQKLVAPLIPVAGHFLAHFISLYFLMVEMNILGSFYYTQRRKLAWFRE